jgi:hypothetical protein
VRLRDDAPISGESLLGGGNGEGGLGAADVFEAVEYTHGQGVLSRWQGGEPQNVVFDR